MTLSNYRPGCAVVKYNSEGNQPDRRVSLVPVAISGHSRESCPLPARRTPDCFEDHRAPESVRIIFEQLVEIADESDNGRAAVNLRGFTNPTTDKPYGSSTVQRALQWLTVHRLVMKTKEGGGRGNHSEYFVRWSTDHETLSKRQSSINHRREKVATRYDKPTQPLPSIEEGQDIRPSNENACTNASPSHSWESSTPKIDQTQSIQRAMKHLRPAIEALPPPFGAATADDLCAGFAWSLLRAIRRGHITTGGELANMVNHALTEIRSLDGIPEVDSFCYSFAGMVVRDAIHGKPKSTPTPQRWQQPSNPQPTEPNSLDPREHEVRIRSKRSRERRPQGEPVYTALGGKPIEWTN